MLSAGEWRMLQINLYFELINIQLMNFYCVTEIGNVMNSGYF